MNEGAAARQKKDTVATRSVKVVAILIFETEKKFARVRQGDQMGRIFGLCIGKLFFFGPNLENCRSSAKVWATFFSTRQFIYSI
jgi:hypothetical protein